VKYIRKLEPMDEIETFTGFQLRQSHNA